MAFYLGIDAGGSKTVCAVADEGAILGSFTVASCKIQQVGRETAERNLLAAIRGALLEAEIAGVDIRSSCVGISGISNPEVGELVKKTLRTVVAGEVLAVGDHIIAHEAAFRGEAGVLVIAGTGSIAYGRNEKGRTARAGGEGPEISDEGSGFWIGREAVRVLRTAALPTGNADAMSVTALAELFPKVVEASRAGDEGAADILQRAGGELAKLAARVIEQLWPNKDAKVRVAGAGGVLANSSEVRTALKTSLREMKRNAEFDHREVRAVEGALFLARNARNQQKTQDSSLPSE